MASKIKGWLVTEQNVTVNYDGKTYIVARTDALATNLIKAIKEGREGDIPALVSAAQRIETYSNGKFKVQDGLVMVNGVAAPDFLSQKIIRFSNEDLPVEPLVKFAEKLQANPSYRAVNELFQFLEKNNHPITEHGNFIAYKKVRSDFKDAYTGTMDNSVGTTVTMPRNQVNEDPTQTCSYGLHVANWDYAHNVYSAGDGSVMLEVEVSPADVVAVPVDYSNSKMRVCSYKVLSVVLQPHEDGVSLRVTEPEKFNSNSACEGCSDCNGSCHEDTEEEYCGYCLNSDCFGECMEDHCEICEQSECYGDCSSSIEEDRYPYEDELK